MAKRTPIFAANWKMNKTLADLQPYTTRLDSRLDEVCDQVSTDFEVILFPPACFLETAARLVDDSEIQVGSQNSGPAPSGAFTGELPPRSLREMGIEWTLIGHSERRHVFKETDTLIAKRLQAALEGGLSAMLCVGELLEERKAGKTMTTIESQLKIVKEVVSSTKASHFALAYEPVWAIGTGENATPEQAQEVHAFIRKCLIKNGWSEGATVRILYGGSAKPDNSGALMGQPDIDGLLVGGASLEADTFAELVRNGLTSRLKS